MSDTQSTIPRKSWQRTTKTKFREHLSFISTKTSNSLKDIKSAWSPVTPNDDERRLFQPSSPPPPLPPIPIIAPVQLPTAVAIASHTRTIEQEPDSDRTFSVQRARAEAAAMLERGAKERQAERDRLDREREVERKRRELWERERAYEASKAKQDESGWDDDENTTLEDIDMEKGSRADPSNGRSINPVKSFSSKLLRLSRAVFKPPTPLEPSSPFPRDDHEEQDGPAGSRVSSWLAFVPSRASHLHPWSPLHIQKHSPSHAGSEAGEARSVVHNHYYGNMSHSNSSRPLSNAEAYSLESAHLEGKHKGKERRNERCPSCRMEAEQEKRSRSRYWMIGLIILLLLIIGSVVFINLYVIPKSHKSSVASTNATSPITTTVSQSGSVVPTATTVTSAAPTSTVVSPALQACLTQFTAATNSPSSFSCNSCVPLLSNVPNDFSPSLTLPAPVQGVGAALQFCALSAVNDNLPSANATALTAVGWLQNTRVCTWSGVTCDSKGRVNSLQLITPAVPENLPSDLQFLVALTSLKIDGNGANPGGPMSPLMGFRELTALSLLQTGLSGSFSGTELSSAFPDLNQLFLQENTDIQLGGPSLGGITQMANLTQLTINLQPLPSNALDILTDTGNSTPIPLSKSLTDLNLAGTGLTGTLSAGLAQGLPNLAVLNLNQNVFSVLPNNSDGIIFPSKLSQLSLSGNTGMSGTLTAAQCDALQASDLSTCDLTGTAIEVASGVSPTEGGCAKCNFS